jgi:RNA polymerase sigma-70 factor (ECF subfamily)
MLPDGLPAPDGRGEITWVEPCPDTLLEGLADRTPGPDVRYEVSESVSLAFVTALQVLSPRGRAVLILRDVLGFHTGEVARILETTEESVASALKRARMALQRERSSEGWDTVAGPRSSEERELVQRFTRAFEATDVNALVALLTQDVRFSMPPLPFEWRGHEGTGRFLEAVWAVLDSPPRLVPIGANRQPAFAFYARFPGTAEPALLGLLVLTLGPHGIRAIDRFESPSLHQFNLPATIGG